MSDPLLEVRDLKTHFYTSRGIVKAVDGVNLHVGVGEAVGLVGESGCGKSMTAFSIMGLVPNPPGRIVDGQILFQSQDLLLLPPDEARKYKGKQVSMVFQDPMAYLNPVLQVGEQIAEAVRLHQGTEGVQKTVAKTLEMVGFARASSIENRYPHELSGGMRQRVLLAIALACRPKLLIADEPTTALDVTIQAQILELINQIRAELGMALLLITHDLGIVAEMCDRVYVMYAGRVAESADIWSIFERPAHPYSIGLLQAVQSINGRDEILQTIEGTVPDLISPPPGCRFATRCPVARMVCLEDPPRIDLDAEHYSVCWRNTPRYQQSSPLPESQMSVPLGSAIPEVETGGRS